MVEEKKVARINMDLTSEDETRLNKIKKMTGITQNTEVIRFCLAVTSKQELN